MQLNNSERIVTANDCGAIDHPDHPTIEIEQALASSAEVSPLFTPQWQTGASKWLWFGLVLSVALHVGLILVPSGETPPPAADKPKAPEKQVRITQLAKLKRTVKQPKPVVKPTVKPVVRKATTPPIPLAVKPPPPIAEQPKPSPQEAQASPNSPAKDAEQSGSWDDFPIYPGAQPGCFGLPSCLQTADPMQQIADYYAKALPAKKYELKPATAQPGQQVFQVSRQGESQFLSIVQTENGQAIVLSDAPISLQGLKKAVEVPPEVAAILSSLAAENAKPTDLAQPDVVYTKSGAKGYASGSAIPKPEVVNISLVRSYSFDTMMNEFFRSNLQSAGFEVTDLPQGFGGGKLYKVSKGSTTLILNLLPTKNNNDTLIVTWKNTPK